jgi:hypothetical protein
MSEGYAMKMAMEMARNMQEAMTGAFFAPGAGTQFLCTQGATMREGKAIDSEKRGTLEEGSEIVALEMREIDGGVVRVRFRPPGRAADVWASTTGTKVSTEPRSVVLQEQKKTGGGVRWKVLALAEMQKFADPKARKNEKLGGLKRGEVVVGLESCVLKKGGTRVRVLTHRGAIGWCSLVDSKGHVQLEQTQLLSGVPLKDGEVWGEEERVREWLSMQGFENSEEQCNIITGQLFEKNIRQKQWLENLQQMSKAELEGFAKQQSAVLVAPKLSSGPDSWSAGDVATMMEDAKALAAQTSVMILAAEDPYAPIEQADTAVSDFEVVANTEPKSPPPDVEFTTVPAAGFSVPAPGRWSPPLSEADSSVSDASGVATRSSGNVSCGLTSVPARNVPVQAAGPVLSETPKVKFTGLTQNSQVDPAF